MPDIAEDEVDKIVESVAKRGKKKTNAQKEADAEDGIQPDGEAKLEKGSVADLEPPLPPPAPASADGAKAITLEQLEALGQIIPDLPKPAENVKSLGDMISKYGVGQRPDFRLQIYRTWPKVFPGGRKADGFLDDYDSPIDESFIKNEYGGGEFLVRVVGPKSGTNLGWAHYDSIRVNIQGEPKWNRVSKQQQTQDAMKEPGQFQVTSGGAPAHEDPKIVIATLDAMKAMVESEREDRRRGEQRQDTSAQQASVLASPIIEAEQRRTADVLRLERERAEAEKKALEQRAEMERDRADERQRMLEKQLEEQKQKTEEILRRFQDMENSRPSLASEFKELMSVMPRPEPPPPPPPPPRGELELAGKVLDQSADKHRAEIESLRTQHQSLIESLRAGHEREIAATREANVREIAAMREQQTTREARHEEQTRMERAAHDRELAALREAHARELHSEREQWKHREVRYEDQIRLEREERRRDQDRAREIQVERDQAAKDRYESLEATIKQQYESRISMIETNHAERVRWLQQEIDNKVREIGEVRSKLQDTHDPVAQMARFREFREAAQHGLGLAEPSPPSSSSSSSGSSGIGLSGSGFDMNEIARDLVDKGPDLLTAAANLFRGPSAQQQQQPGAGQFVPGQVVQTPMGQMMVVQTEQGPQLMPLNQPAPTRLLPAGDGKKPQAPQAPRYPMPPGGVVQPGTRPRQQPRRKRVSENFDPLPNLAEGLERPIPPWEKKPSPFAEKPAAAKPAASQGPAPQQPQQSQSQAVAAAPSRPERIQMNAIEKQIAQMVAKLVHESVSTGDDPEDFVKRILDDENIPTAILEGVAAKSDDEILAGIRAVEPRSAGASPAGEQFVRKAMRLLREDLAQDDGDEA